jgi:DNA repair exonuclease SbcCD ATPase subunit
MARGWHAWVMRYAALPCPLLLTLAACTPPPGGIQRPITADAAANSEIFPSSGVQGRFYALGQALAHEQQRTADLQAQLDERSHQIERLQGEVEQLRQHENDLQATLDRATAAQAAGQAAAARAGGGKHRGHGKPADDEPASEGTDQGGGADQGERAATIASLRTALAKELLRREAAETELERLKAETSTPALADAPSATSAAELTAAKQEVADLRTALESEREARASLADKLEKIQQRAPSDTASDANPPSAEMQERLRTLESERQAAIDSFNRSLAASQERAAGLERQLAEARAANAVAATTESAASDGAGPKELASIRAENTALRERLDEEHRRTEQLSSKLKLATRVTDLIFKMQSQQAQAAGQAPQGQVPAVPQSNPWLDR